MSPNIRFLLLQVRDGEDPMRDNEVTCFRRALGCRSEQIGVWDLLAEAPSPATLDRSDVVLLGGSGDYSATGEGEWLYRALDSLRHLHAIEKPTFASCWGFQAMARALGGQVVNDPAQAELGTIDLVLTDEGRQDPVFAPVGENFRGQAGHQDRVVTLPDGAQLLASSDRVKQQAYRFVGLPVYCTQFHPELRREDLLARVRAYPEYVKRIAGVPYAEFTVGCRETPEAEGLLRRFVDHVLG